MFDPLIVAWTANWYTVVEETVGVVKLKSWFVESKVTHAGKVWPLYATKL